MKSWLKWGLAGLVCLAILGAVFGEDEKPAEAESVAAAATPASSPAAAATDSATPDPTPTPKPEVSISITGPSSARSDNATLKGTVDPPSARVRVKGKTVKVR